MVAGVGRGLQWLALILLPVAIVLELSGALGRSFGLSQLLIALVFAVLAFVLGRLLEGYGNRSGNRTTHRRKSNRL